MQAYAQAEKGVKITMDTAIRDIIFQEKSRKTHSLTLTGIWAVC